MNWARTIKFVLVVLYLMMLVGAIFSHLIYQRAPVQGMGSSAFLFIAGLLLLLTSNSKERRRLLLLGVLGFCAEVIGVKGGWLFGSYHYTQVLAPNVFGVPLAMFCAWVVLLSYAKFLIRSYANSTLIAASFVALVMVSIDFVLDPVATNIFKFWSWNEPGAYYGIPLQNYFGWFVTSFWLEIIANNLFGITSSENVWVGRLGGGIIIFYTVCAVNYGLLVPALIGVILIVVQGATGFILKNKDQGIWGCVKKIRVMQRI